MAASQALQKPKTIKKDDTELGVANTDNIHVQNNVEEHPYRHVSEHLHKNCHVNLGTKNWSNFYCSKQLTRKMSPTNEYNAQVADILVDRRDYSTVKIINFSS